MKETSDSSKRGRSETPHPDITIVAPGHDLVIDKIKTCHGTAVAHKCMARLVILAIPDLIHQRNISSCGQSMKERQKRTHLDSSIMTSRDKSEFIARHGPNAFNMPKVRLEVSSGLDVPELERIIE